MWRRVSVALVALAAFALVAEARPGAVVVRGPERTSVDWSRGLIIAVGAAAGDLRAPSPAVARVAAARKAMEQARARLRAQARQLELHGASVAALAERDPAIRRRLDHEVAKAVRLDIDYGSDGSAVVTAGLPLEAVRAAVAGAPRPGSIPLDDTPSAVVVDAREVLSRPALGVEVVTPAGRFAPPAVFYRTMKAALADARVGRRPVRVRARGLAGAGPALELGPKRPGKGKAGARMARVAAALETGAPAVIVIGR